MQSTELVTLQGDVPMTTSRIVAEVFEKRHDHVLRAIDGILLKLKNIRYTDIDTKFMVTTFDVQIPYAVRKDRGFLISSYGFALLAMGFTGTKAMARKVLFLDEFRRVSGQIT